MGLSARAWEAAIDLWDAGHYRVDVWHAKALGPDAIPPIMAGLILLLHRRVIGVER